MYLLKPPYSLTDVTHVLLYDYSIIESQVGFKAQT